MRLWKHKNQAFFLIMMLGFFMGILYANLISGTYQASTVLFQPYYLEQYCNRKVVTEDYMGYVLWKRGSGFGTLCLLGCCKWKKAVVAGWLGWNGLLLGVLTVQAVLWLGIKGIFLCITAMIPHMCCYVLVYGVYLLYLYEYPKRRWTLQFVTGVAGLLFLGVCLEVYISPLFLKGFIRLFV